jgi:anaerobic C4-dicarboxylate transporter
MWPDWVIAFVGDGRIALLALAVIGVEALLVLLFLRRRARIGSLILTMASGAGLLGALYAALSGASAGIIAVWLVLALVAHASDMGTRLFSRN